MPGMSGMIPASSPAVRVHQGESIVAMTWSNTATQLWGYFRVVYDDGTDDEITLNRTLLVNTRTMGVMVSNQVFHRDGYVVSGQICQVSGVANQSSQRGQCYVRALVVTDSGIVQIGSVSPANCRAMLCQGYIYSGIDVPLGQMVEPGPAGGHGQTVNLALTQPAAGADYANSVAPSGSIRKIKGFFGQLVTSATVANREFSIQSFVTTIRGGVVAGEIQTASLTVDYVGQDGSVASSGTTSNLAGGVTQIGLGNMVIVGGVSDSVAFKTYNIQVGDQWGTGNLIYEEWVMPN